MWQFKLHQLKFRKVINNRETENYQTTLWQILLSGVFIITDKNKSINCIWLAISTSYLKAFKENSASGSCQCSQRNRLLTPAVSNLPSSRGTRCTAAGGQPCTLRTPGAHPRSNTSTQLWTPRPRLKEFRQEVQPSLHTAGSPLTESHCPPVPPKSRWGIVSSAGALTQAFTALNYISCKTMPYQNSVIFMLSPK